MTDPVVPAIALLLLSVFGLGWAAGAEWTRINSNRRQRAASKESTK